MTYFFKGIVNNTKTYTISLIVYKVFIVYIFVASPLITLYNFYNKREGLRKCSRTLKLQRSKGLYTQ